MFFKIEIIFFFIRSIRLSTVYASEKANGDKTINHYVYTSLIPMPYSELFNVVCLKIEYIMIKKPWAKAIKCVSIVDSM